MTDLKKLKELAGKATPGPWARTADMHEIVCETSLYDGQPGYISICEISQSVCDSEYIAAANPSAILELIQRLEEAERQRDCPYQHRIGMAPVALCSKCGWVPKEKHK